MGKNRFLRILCGGKDEASDDGPTRTGQTSAIHACVSIVKCVVGAGSFFLPYGLKKAGLWGGAAGILLLGLLCNYINYRVVQCKRKLFGGRTIAYPDLAEATFGIWVRRMSYVLLLIQGLGACAVYAVFCGDLLHAVASQVSVLEWVLIIGTIEVLFSWIRSFSYVGLTSVMGDAALVLGVTVVFVYGFKDGGFIDSPLNMPIIRIETYPQFFGTAAFLFSVTMYLFPIESSMREPKRFNTSLFIAFFITTIGNAVFASFAYMFFGDDVQAIVIDNLGHSALVTVAKVALVLDLVFTFVIVFVPCRTVVEDSVLGHHGLWHWWRRGRFAPSPSPSSSFVSTPSISTTQPSFLLGNTPPSSLTSSSSAAWVASSQPSSSRSSSWALSSSSGGVRADSTLGGSSGDTTEQSYPDTHHAQPAGKVGGGGVVSINYADDMVVSSEDRGGESRGLLLPGPDPKEEDLVPHWERMVVRTGMIGATVGLACAIPNVIDLVGLIVGVSNSMNSFVLPTLIYMRVRYREKNEGFVSVDLEEQRKEDRKREKRKKREKEKRKRRRKERKQRGTPQADDADGDQDDGSIRKNDSGAGHHGHRKNRYEGGGDQDNEDGDSGGPSNADSGGEDGDSDGGEQQQIPERENKRDSAMVWLLWMQQTAKGRKGNERRSGVVYWVREAVHWTFHSLIVVFGVAMGVLTTIQAVQTVVSDYA